jgi:N-acetylneuraminate synthase
MCRHGKPVLIATGASTMAEVEAAMEVALAETGDIVLMQCNTEYTAKLSDSRQAQLERFSHINLRVLETYANRWPGIPLGLSDHTHGALTVLGAVGLFDCCAVEKHFTFDNTLEGQDHAFSMTPDGWRRMVEQTRALKSAIGGARGWAERYRITRGAVDDPEVLDLAIGDGVKRLEANEAGPAIVQRRAVRAARPLKADATLAPDDLVALRPCPADGVPPYRASQLLGRVLVRDVASGDCIRLEDLGPG